MLKGKKILIGITGGIAAYKICELIRMYKRQNAEVTVIATPNALKFVTVLTLQTLSQNPVYVEQYEFGNYKPEHISLSDWADIFVIAPASANTIGKIANGISDNLLTSVASAFGKKFIIAPAMNCGMWDNPLVQKNISTLKDLDYEIVEPEVGYLACGATGKGRLCILEKIFDKTVEILNSDKAKKKLLNKKIIITAGGTIEKLDTVRYISNFSSGKMGEALADRAYALGANVILITTKQFSKPYPIVEVTSASEMKNAVLKEFQTCDIAIMTAAVADFRAKEISTTKLKKGEENSITIELVKNPDILKEISDKKTKKQMVVGFCAESENLLKNAQSKIEKKGCDYLIANDISRKDIGFSSEYNEVHILNKNGNIKKLEKATKKEIAEKIFEEILN